MTPSIDVSGLPPAVVEDLRRLVATLRGHVPTSAAHPDQPPDVTAEDFDHLLDEFSADLPALPCLPAGFLRAEIYGEHD
jgi:hypothetical protein